MTFIAVNGSLEAILSNVEGPVEICTSNGLVLGRFEPGKRKLSYEEMAATSPTSQEEIERRRGEGGGRPLGDILRDLGVS